MSGPIEGNRVERLALAPTYGGGCCAIGLIAFVGGFVWLAVSNIIAYWNAPSFRPFALVGLVASVLWLLIVAFTLYAVLHEIGLRPFAIEFLGMFSYRHFAEVRRDADRIVLSFGYELFRRRFYYLRLDSDWLVSIDMSTGQASH